MDVVDFYDKRLALCGAQDVDSIAAFVSGREFAVLLPVDSDSAKEIALRCGRRFVELGCKEFCCVGSLAADTEDELDCLLEDEGRTDIVTTSFDHEEDAAEYFLFAAGGATFHRLVAMVEGRADLSARLTLLLDTPWSQ